MVVCSFARRATQRCVGLKNLHNVRYRRHSTMPFGGVPNTQYSALSIEPEEAIAVVKLARPKVNALSVQMATDIIDFCKVAADRPPESLRALVISGEGSVFSCGYDMDDLESMSSSEETAFLELAFQSIYSLYMLPVPVIAAINGPAAGWGLAMALAADMAIVHPATILNFPETSLGLLPAAAFLLHRKGYGAVGRELVFTGKKITGTDAKEMGLVNILASDPLGAAMEIAQNIAQNAAVAVRQYKRLLIKLEGGSVTDKEAVQLTKDLGAPLAASKDHKEAIRALKRGHLPSFTGL